jgi:hypothetical protein
MPAATEHCGVRRGPASENLQGRKRGEQDRSGAACAEDLGYPKVSTTVDQSQTWYCDDGAKSPTAKGLPGRKCE